MAERQAHTSSMTHEQWWSKLTPESQTWLIENNGDVVPDAIAREVEAAGGPPRVLKHRMFLRPSRTT